MPLTPENSAGLYDDAAPTVDIEDTSPDVQPEDFDPAAFLKGVRSQRRAVKIFTRPDLLAELEHVVNELDSLPAAAQNGKAAAELRKKGAQLQADFLASGVWWELEERSEDWIERTQEQAVADLGVDVKIDHNAPLGDQGIPGNVVRRIMIRQLQGQVVTPSGVTVDMLEEMYRLIPTEVFKLFTAMAAVNASQAQRSGLLTLDFSQRRSDNRSQRRSSTPSK